MNDTSNEQGYKDLSEDGFTENPKLPVLKEEPHSVSVELGEKGQATFLGILPAFEVEEGQLDCQRHSEVINNRRREQDACTLRISPQYF